MLATTMSESSAKRGRKRRLAVDKKVLLSEVDEQADALDENWRHINPDEECFLIKALPQEEAFLELTVSGARVTAVEIFKSFLSDDIIQRLTETFPVERTDLGMRRTRRGQVTTKRFIVDSQKVWQMLAVQIRIIGSQVRSNGGSDHVGRPLRQQVSDAIAHFRSLTKRKIANSQIVERLIAQCLLKEEYASVIAFNFQSLIKKLGQSVAGDEKQFRFTGDSGNFRLVISKPDGTGLWFYDLCGELRNGLPYLLDVVMHSSTKSKVSVESIVTRWAAVMDTVGRRSQREEEEENLNADCYLVMDSCYMDSPVRTLLRDCGRNFTCSVTPDSFKAEARAVHPPGSDDRVGQFRGLRNAETGEVFVYHFDARAEVGKTYNYSSGFIRSVDRAKIAEHKHRIPVCDYYKQMFEPCDHFNRRLHDMAWPHKRGGHRGGAEDGLHHDFLIACILQNTFNAFCAATDQDHRQLSFKDFCHQLADSLINES